MNIEEQAREEGWVPKEDWKGDPEKWTNAEIFVEKGEKITGILKSRVDRQQREINNLKQANQEFGAFTKAQQDVLRKENERLISELQEKRATAITDGDGQEFNRLEKKIETLKIRPEVQASSSNPLGDAWVTENDWYNTNRKMHIYADGLSEVIWLEGFRGQAYFDELTHRVKEDNPKEFENPNKSRSNTVETGNESVRDEKAQTYENLPADAKQACDRFVKNGLMTAKDYVKSYEWES